MRKPEARTVITFHTTAEAMAAERLFRELALPGKLITVPRQLSSDCGLAWSAPAELGGTVVQAITARGLGYDGVYPLAL